MVPIVFAVGSCRVLRPLRRLASDGSIALRSNTDPSWFTHSSGEALQYARALAGEVQIPPHLRKFVCETDATLPEDLKTDAAFVSDFAVAEISTLKTLSLEGIRLNYHLVWGEAQRLGIEARPLLNGDTSALPPGHALQGLSAGRSTAKEVQEDLLALRALTRLEVLAVDHLWAALPDGTMAPEREEIAHALKGVSESTSIGFWSTRSIFDGVGGSPVKDHNHWKPEYEDQVGEAIVSAGLRLAPEPA